MAYFPLYINLSAMSVLVVGAGEIGARKIEKLLMFNPKLKVISKSFSSEVLEWNLQNSFEIEQRSFEISDLEKVDLVIVATEDIELQKTIFEACQKTKILCNCVDVPQYCTFIFPALVKQGDVVIGINTGGKAPGLSAFLRKKLTQFLPNNLAELQNEVSRLRKDDIQKKLKTYSERAARIDAFLEQKWNQKD